MESRSDPGYGGLGIIDRQLNSVRNRVVRRTKEVPPQPDFARRQWLISWISASTLEPTTIQTRSELLKLPMETSSATEEMDWSLDLSGHRKKQKCENLRLKNSRLSIECLIQACQAKNARSDKPIKTIKPWHFLLIYLCIRWLFGAILSSYQSIHHVFCIQRSCSVCS